MVNVASLATGLVVTGNVAVVAFAATVTLAGTWAAAVLLLASVTAAPLAAAGAASVTVAIELLPPTTLAGPNASDDTDCGLTVRVPDWFDPL